MKIFEKQYKNKNKKLRKSMKNNWKTRKTYRKL